MNLKSWFTNQYACTNVYGVRCLNVMYRLGLGQCLADVGRAVSETEGGGNLLCNASGRLGPRMKKGKDRQSIFCFLFIYRALEIQPLTISSRFAVGHASRKETHVRMLVFQTEYLTCSDNSNCRII